MRLAICVALAALACGPSDLPLLGNGGSGGGGAGGSSGGGGSSSLCVTGVRRCEGSTLTECSSGVFSPIEECPMACDALRGCVLCVPGGYMCAGQGVSRLCNSDGTGWDEIACDAVQGLRCDDATGRCSGPCAPERISRSYIGCEYYPTVTANPVSSAFSFAVAIANTTDDSALVTIEEGGLASPLTFAIGPGEVATKTLPWVDALKLCSGPAPCAAPTATGALARRGAYRLRSTVPVTVYQFNPLEYQNTIIFSYSNDASLLLPTHAWRRNYVSAAWQAASPRGQSLPGIIAITASEDDTHLAVEVKANVSGGGGAPPMTPGIPGTLTLGRGDVVELVAFAGDLTGSVVVSDKPVQVIAGHFCANVPVGVEACDHMEESMLPIDTLGATYLVTAPFLPALQGVKEQVVRIIAAENDVDVMFDPAPSGVLNPTHLSSIGDFVEIARRSDDYQVMANGKILVVSYFEGQNAGGGTGDPSSMLAVPTDQYRSRYLFHAPRNYESSFVNITAPMGATVMLDGAPVTGFTAIGSSGFGVARSELGVGVSGNHTVTGSEPFGITVYGYGTYTSYAYPGGLDLKDVVVP